MLKKFKFLAAFLGAAALAPCVSILPAHAVVSDLDTRTVTSLGDGADTTWTIGFDFRDNDDIVVQLQDESTTPYTRTTLDYGVAADEFTITGGDPGTTVLMGTAPSATERLIISRATPLTQPVDYDPAAAFPVDDHEEQMDRMTQAVQELDFRVDRAVTLDEGSTGTVPTFPDPTANRFIGYNNAADDLTLIPSTAPTSGDFLTFTGSAWEGVSGTGTGVVVRTASPNITSPALLGSTTVQTDLTVGSQIIGTAFTADRILYGNGSKVITSHANATSTHLGYLANATGNLCGVAQSCTLSNKTLTSPTLTTATFTGSTVGESLQLSDFLEVTGVVTTLDDVGIGGALDVGDSLTVTNSGSVGTSWAIGTSASVGTSLTVGTTLAVAGTTTLAGLNATTGTFSGTIATTTTGNAFDAEGSANTARQIRIYNANAGASAQAYYTAQSNAGSLIMGINGSGINSASFIDGGGSGGLYISAGHASGVMYLRTAGSTVAQTLTGANTAMAGGLTIATTLGVTGASTLAALSATTGAFSSTLGVTGISTLAAMTATTGTFSGALTATAGPLVVGTAANSYDLEVRKASVAGNINAGVINTDNTDAGSGARLIALVGGASAGDPRVVVGVTGVAEWSMGLDNSDSDSFKIGNDSVVGTNTHLSITTAGAVTVPGTLAITGSTTSTGTLTASAGLVGGGNTTLYGNVGIGSTPSSDALVRTVSPTTATGTAAIAGSSTITGTGTEFLTQFRVGDSVTIAGETNVINGITSDTAMTTTGAFVGTSSGNAITRVATPHIFLYPNGTIQSGGTRSTLAAFNSTSNRLLIVQDAASAGATSNQTAIAAIVGYMGGATGTSNTPAFTGTKVRGSEASPSVVQSGDGLLNIDFRGYDASSAFSGAGIRIQGQATETFSGTAHGAKLLFATVPNTTTTLITRWTMNEGGSFEGTATASAAESATLVLNEKDTTPAAPTADTQAKMYIKSNKVVFEWNDGGTTRYKYLDLTGTGVTWVHDTSAP